MGVRLFADIRARGNRVASAHAKNINLDRSVRIIVPLKRIISYAIVSFFIFSLVLGSANAPVNRGGLLAASNRETERAELEAQLRDLEQQITQYEGTVDEYRKQGKSLEGEIQRLNDKIAKLNLQIKAIILNLKKLDGEIESTKVKISETEQDISKNKTTLSALLQNLYENESKTIVELIIANPKLSDFFLDLNNLLVMQDNLRVTLEQVVEFKTQLVNQKEVLAFEYNDIDELRQYQEAQRKSISQTETEKQTLLKETRGQESRYTQVLEEKKKTAAQIRSRIFELLGGGELSFGEAYRLAKIAQDATGVRAALILAVLDGESALGRNVGRCTYDKNPYYPGRASNPTTMHPTRDIPVFLAITQELGLDPATTVVSCPIPQDGAYGGALGPAQFLPSTWMKYRDQVAALTGSNPPSPWSNLDAFVATALYLKGAGAASASLYNEKVAAAKYYAGSRWSYYLNSYGASVVTRAEEFQDDIDILTS